jgi:hypothetical protein
LLAERFSDHFFALLPEGFGIDWVQRVGSDAFADAGDRHVVCGDFADVAILAILAADVVSRGNDDVEDA